MIRNIDGVLFEITSPSSMSIVNLDRGEVNIEYSGIDWVVTVTDVGGMYTRHRFDTRDQAIKQITWAHQYCSTAICRSMDDIV